MAAAIIIIVVMELLLLLLLRGMLLSIFSSQPLSLAATGLSTYLFVISNRSRADSFHRFSLLRLHISPFGKGKGVRQLRNGELREEHIAFEAKQSFKLLAAGMRGAGGTLQAEKRIPGTPTDSDAI